MSQHSVGNDRQRIDPRYRLRQANARQVLLASADVHGGDQPATRQADHTKRSIGLRLILSPNPRLFETWRFG